MYNIYIYSIGCGSHRITFVWYILFYKCIEICVFLGDDKCLYMSVERYYFRFIRVGTRNQVAAIVYT